MVKPSEKYSSVPNFIRDKFREYKKNEKDSETERNMKERANAPPLNSSSESDSRALEEMIDQYNAAEDQSKYRKFNEGGMVKKPRASRGDGCATRGYTKGKVY